MEIKMAKIGDWMVVDGKRCVGIDQSGAEVLALEKLSDGYGLARWVDASKVQVEAKASDKELDEAMRFEARRAVRARAVRFVEAKPAFDESKPRIAPSGKVVGAAEVEMMTEAAMDCWLTAGRFSDRFEMRLALKLGAARALAVNSGSSANLVALSALTSPKLGDRRMVAGDEVVTAAAGFPTTINPILQNGLVPVLVDSNVDDGNIDCDQVEASIGPRTKAIMAAHTLGNPMDMRRLRTIADKHGLWLIEDCCDALGSRLDGKLCGSFGDLGTLSFYPAHHITMGEGGAVFGGDLELMRIVESFRDWGRDCYCAPGRDNTCGKRFCQKMGDLPEGYDHKYTYTHAGYNLKITDMQAAVGLAQLDRLDGFVQKRKDNHVFLASELERYGFGEWGSIQKPIEGADPSWFGFLVTLREDCGVSRSEFVQYLEQQGISTRLLFAGNVTKQPYFKERHARVPFELTNADALMNRAFWVGNWPGLGEAELSYMAKTMATYFGLAGF
jgi:CDP-6-deoxy-D-xylo-4-hexulose-3-dehydrase